jgi:hypothetical protein
MREWNRKGDLLGWRSAWADCANLHLARAGYAVRIDHRSFAAQQIELIPARRTGVGRPLAALESLPEHLQARLVEQRQIAHANGSAIVADPAIAIRALARQRRRFTRADLGRFLASRTGGRAQLDAALAMALACAELVAVGAAQGAAALYTSRDLLEAEKALKRRAQNLTKRGDLQSVAVPGGQLHEYLRAVRRHWLERGRQVRDALPPSGDALATHEVVLVQGAEMLDLKTLERHLDAAERARATLVLVADAQRLQAMGVHSPMYELVAPDSPLVP